jgi:hypothetical protein
LRIVGKVEGLLALKSCRTTFALDRLDERQRGVAVEREDGVVKIRRQVSAEPAGELLGRDTPALGSVDHLAGL